jgi:hypothetical protein
MAVLRVIQMAVILFVGQLLESDVTFLSGENNWCYMVSKKKCCIVLSLDNRTFLYSRWKHKVTTEELSYTKNMAW